MSTDKAQADAATAGGDGSLFAGVSSAGEEAAATAGIESAETDAPAPAAEEDETDLGGEVVPAAVSEGNAEGETVGARETAASPSQTAAPLPPKTRILPDEDEPYVFKDCTINIQIQLLPDDGDAEGREVIVAVSSHIEGPLVELTRLTLLGELPPPLVELLKQHEDRLPALAEAREAQRQRESARTTTARSKTTVRGANGKSSTSAKPVAGGSSSTNTQSSLFDLNTGHRPKAAESPAAGGK
jgi:hypothetical protein